MLFALVVNKFFFCICIDRQDLHSFPTRRSSDLAGFGQFEREQAPGRSVSAVVGGQQHAVRPADRSEEHTSELQSRRELVCRLLLEKKNLVLERSQPSLWQLFYWLHYGALYIYFL